MKYDAAVIGHPIGHSLSPAIFSFVCASRNAGIRPSARDLLVRYEAQDVAPDRLSGFVDGVRKRKGFVGMNVTLPHKEAILPLLDSVSDEARSVGAVNVVRSAEGGLKGFNTDVSGIRKTWAAAGLKIADRSVLILGAGGAARAVAYALGQEGAREVQVWNRSSAKAKALCASISEWFPSMPIRALAGPSDLAQGSAEVVIQSTSAGMTGGPDASRDFGEWIDRMPNGASALDLVYRPERTPFIERASAKGLRVYGGLEMLIDQALDTWEIWFGALGERTRIREDLKGFLNRRLCAPPISGPIVLIGMMGSGKSSVGRELAHELGWEFVDLDERLEEDAKKPIPEIFSSEGEAAFRKLEERAFAELVFRPSQVISLGGGAFMTPSIRERTLKEGRSIYLSAEVSELESRLREESDRRPLLAGLDESERKQRLQELLDRRAAGYQLAETTLRTEGLSPSQLAGEIIGRLSGDRKAHG